MRRLSNHPRLQFPISIRPTSASALSRGLVPPDPLAGCDAPWCAHHPQPFGGRFFSGDGDDAMVPLKSNVWGHSGATVQRGVGLCVGSGDWTIVPLKSSVSPSLRSHGRSCSGDRVLEVLAPLTVRVKPTGLIGASPPIMGHVLCQPHASLLYTHGVRGV